MTVKYSKHVSTKTTPQSDPIPDKDMVANSAGGYSFAVDKWKRLERFLILGNEGGSYYASEKKLTQENASSIKECFDENPQRTIDTIVDISKNGRAAKNDPAIFALALLSKSPLALDKINDVCRTGYHLFQFVEAAEQFRGYGPAYRRVLGQWYTAKKPRDLAYQVTKYQQRNGWTHRDVLRLCHLKVCSNSSSDESARRDIIKWAVKGAPEDSYSHNNYSSVIEGLCNCCACKDYSRDDPLAPIHALESAKSALTKKDIVKLINNYRLVRECIPTQWLSEPEVWDALLEDMPMMATIRNLATMTRVGTLKPMGEATWKVRGRLTDKEKIRQSRLHPLTVLNALRIYSAGKGDKGKNTWDPLVEITDALDKAFYLAFDNVEPTGKRFLIAQDVSGSMGGSMIGGTSMTCREAATALSLVTASTEPIHHIVSFQTELKPLNISPRQRLMDAIKEASYWEGGGTDCSQPMIYALKNKIPVDVFMVLTDSETWAGHIHPTQALQQYRREMNIPAKLIVVGMVANGFSIADPNDAGMMDVVGFDTNVPALIRDFARAGA